MLKSLDIAWLGALIEGEGCFSENHGSAQIILSMTDRDVVERAARLFGVKVYEQKLRARIYKTSPPYKPAWRLAVCGASAFEWMMTLYQFLGERRKRRVQYFLKKWHASPRWPRAKNGQRSLAVCHPDRPRTGVIDGKPVCNACYLRARSKRRREYGNQGVL